MLTASLSGFGAYIILFLFLLIVTTDDRFNIRCLQMGKEKMILITYKNAYLENFLKKKKSGEFYFFPKTAKICFLKMKLMQNCRDLHFWKR